MWSRLARSHGGGRARYPANAGTADQHSSAASGPAQQPGRLGQGAGRPCPEPNDTFQAACYLGPSSDALGFISTPNDVDAYRIEVLDFNTDVHVEMPSMPAPYKIELANWNGDIIASSSPARRRPRSSTRPSTSRAPTTSSSTPPSGGFSPNRPYQIFRALTYPGASIPDIIDHGEFRPGSRTLFERRDRVRHVHAEGDGRYTISMKIAGTPDGPSQAWSTGLGDRPHRLHADGRCPRRRTAWTAASAIFFRKAIEDNTDDNTYSVVG